MEEFTSNTSPTCAEHQKRAGGEPDDSLDTSRSALNHHAKGEGCGKKDHPCLQETSGSACGHASDSVYELIIIGGGAAGHPLKKIRDAPDLPVSSSNVWKNPEKSCSSPEPDSVI